MYDNILKQLKDIPLECYELLCSKTSSEQERIFRILREIEEYKKN